MFLIFKNIRKWTLIARASKKIDEKLYRDISKTSVNYFIFYNHNVFFDRKRLQADFYSYFRVWTFDELIVALIICMFYEATHATVWNFIFSSNIERFFWRIVCVDIIADVISLLTFFFIVVFYHEHEHKFLPRFFFSRTWNNVTFVSVYRCWKSKWVSKSWR